MNEPICQSGFARSRKAQTIGANKQLSLIVFAIVAIGLIAYGAYYFHT